MFNQVIYLIYVKLSFDSRGGVAGYFSGGGGAGVGGWRRVLEPSESAAV